MRSWEADDAAPRFAELMQLALNSAPQRIAGPDGKSVVVLSEAEYVRLAAPKFANPIRGFSGRELFDAMQNSPLAQAIREGDIPEDWLERSRAASSHCECCARRAAVERRAHERPSLVDFMRNSPLADAFREGELPEDIFDQIRERSRRAAWHEVETATGEISYSPRAAP